MGKMAKKKPAKKVTKPRFEQVLALHQVLLSLFGVSQFSELAEHLREESLEGFDDHHVHHLHHALKLHLPGDRRPELPDADLLKYDETITAVTQQLNERRKSRGEPEVVWKYFQYLALLFTEIYLDWYFRDAEGLRSRINTAITEINDGLAEKEQIDLFDETGDARQQLNKLAFWMATGSGKTLLMHAHILQYQRYLEQHGLSRTLNRIILLTPNEGLSRQHLEEFQKAGLKAEMFNRDGRGLFTGHAIEILEVTKLRNEMGEKTVAVEAFEGNNLVLVDEGHRGTTAGTTGAYMRYRDALCEKGFSFEYSATFRQAVKDDKELTSRYARSIGFDYSYRWFHKDGFGKDFHILNLEKDEDADWRQTYLTGCLLTFFQQQRLYRDRREEFRPFNIEPPLWVFVGGSVTATLSSREAPDIVEILKFLSTFVSSRTDSIARIRSLLAEGLTTSAKVNLFPNQFAYLNTLDKSPAQIFDEALSLLFNAPSGGTLHVEHLRGADGEVALRVGDNVPFGLVNVGDAPKLVKKCEEAKLLTTEREFADSIFDSLNDPSSTVNVLIGAKRFTEGWSSWRVSTMGLMNVGQGEGAQIIQLFGRGVRLKGYGWSLKRSGSTPLFGLPQPPHIKTLETLHIFGVHAKYMAQFRDFLAEEGLTHEEPYTIVLPVIRHLGQKRLRMVRLKTTIRGHHTDSGTAFRRLGPVPTLRPPDASRDVEAKALIATPVVVNWYPEIRAISSSGSAETTGVNQGTLTRQHVAFMDMRRVHLELERFKNSKSWHNLNVTQQGLEDLLNDPRWYRLLIPEEHLAFSSFDSVRRWEQVAVALLKKYTERYYNFRRHEWELPHLEYQDIRETEPNFLPADDNGEGGGHTVRVDPAHTDIIAKLEQLKAAIEQQDLRPWEFRGLKAIWLNQHLYEPLLSADNGIVEITPTPLNKSERTFIEDLRRFCEQNPVYLEGRELYVLRNQSRGRGVGFFEAGNFYPDFILWQVEGSKQFISFVDPKGIRQVMVDDPKVNFRTTVQEIADRLGDPNVSLSSFIVSNTSAATMEQLWKLTVDEMNEMNVLFQVENRATYVETMLARARGLTTT